MRLLALVLLIFLAAAQALATCGAAAVCSDVTASFAGHIEGEGVVATWSTDEESSSIWKYVLKRNGSQVYSEDARQTCNTLQSYGYTDPYGQSADVYSLEVYSYGALECSRNITIE